MLQVKYMTYRENGRWQCMRLCKLFYSGNDMMNTVLQFYA